MNIGMGHGILTKNGLSKMPSRRLKQTCANSCVPVRNPLGHVGFYAPALICKLRLALYHISIF
jgi:hypothetical protein